jgi:hypothetical protein
MSTMTIDSGLASTVMPVVSTAIQGAGMMVIPHQILDAVENMQAPDCEMFGASIGGTVGKGGMVVSASGAVEYLLSMHNFNSALYFTPGLSLSTGKSGDVGSTLYAGLLWNCDSSEDYADGIDISVSLTGKAFPQRFRTALANLVTKHFATSPRPLTGTAGDPLPISGTPLDMLNEASSNLDVNQIDNWALTVSWSPGGDDFSVVIGRDMGKNGNFGKGSAGPGGWAMGVSQSYQQWPKGNVSFK